MSPAARAARRIGAGAAVARRGVVVVGGRRCVAARASPVGAGRRRLGRLQGGGRPGRRPADRASPPAAPTATTSGASPGTLFEEKPVAGIGADNFQQDYLRSGQAAASARATRTRSSWACCRRPAWSARCCCSGPSAAALAAALRRAAQRPRPGARPRPRPASPSSPTGSSHGSVDWFWEFPALAAPAFADAGPGGRAGAPRRAQAAPRRRGPGAALGRAWPAGGGRRARGQLRWLPWLAEREIDRGRDGLARRPRRRLRPAGPRRRPESRSPPEPDLAAGRSRCGSAASSRPRRPSRRRSSASRDNGYALLQLGAIAASAATGEAASACWSARAGSAPATRRRGTPSAARERPVQLSAGSVNARILERSQPREPDDVDRVRSSWLAGSGKPCYKQDLAGPRTWYESWTTSRLRRA